MKNNGVNAKVREGQETNLNKPQLFLSFTDTLEASEPPPPPPHVLPRLPVIVHHGDDDADALYVLIGDVKHQRLVVGGVQRVLLDGRLPLF